MLLGLRQPFSIADAADVVDAEELEDILDTDRVFHVRSLGHQLGPGRQGVEALGVEKRIVLLGQRADDGTERDHFAEFELVQEGNPVENPPLEIVGSKEVGILVHHELHRLHEVECVLDQQDGRVGVGREKLGKRDAAPDEAGRDGSVDMAEGGQPDAFLGRELRFVVIWQFIFLFFHPV